MVVFVEFDIFFLMIMMLSQLIIMQKTHRRGSEVMKKKKTMMMPKYINIYIGLAGQCCDPILQRKRFLALLNFLNWKLCRFERSCWSNSFMIEKGGEFVYDYHLYIYILLLTIFFPLF